jgi:hypothetical protein
LTYKVYPDYRLWIFLEKMRCAVAHEEFKKID